MEEGKWGRACNGVGRVSRRGMEKDESFVTSFDVKLILPNTFAHSMQIYKSLCKR